MSDDAPGCSKADVLVVDDDELLQSLFVRLLSTRGYSVIGPAANAVQALELAQREKPDLALLDIKLPGETDGIELARKLRSAMDLAICFVTACKEDDVFSRARSIGPYFFLYKPFDPRTLVCNIELALQDRDKRAYLPDRSAINGVSIESAVNTPWAIRWHLDTRKASIALLMMRGLHDKEISERLGLPYRTVRTCATKVLARAEARSRAELLPRASSTKIDDS